MSRSGPCTGPRDLQLRRGRRDFDGRPAPTSTNLVDLARGAIHRGRRRIAGRTFGRDGEFPLWPGRVLWRKDSSSPAETGPLDLEPGTPSIVRGGAPLRVVSRAQLSSSASILASGGEERRRRASRAPRAVQPARWDWVSSRLGRVRPWIVSNRGPGSPRTGRRGPARPVVVPLAFPSAWIRRRRTISIYAPGQPVALRRAGNPALEHEPTERAILPRTCVRPRIGAHPQEPRLDVSIFPPRFAGQERQPARRQLPEGLARCYDLMS